MTRGAPRAPGGGRKPKPTTLKMISGNPGKRKLNQDEPEYEAIEVPAPPAWLSPIATDKWHELAPQLSGTKVLTDVDLHNLEMFCQAYSRWRDAEDLVSRMGVVVETPFGPKKNPACTIINETSRQLSTFGAMLGLDPSSRSRIHIPGGKQAQNRFTNLLKPKKAS